MKTEKRKLENNTSRKNLIFDNKYWELIHSCEDNINELIKCAELLLKNKCYSKSFLMSFLALEELGKRLAICDYIEDILSEEEFVKIFRDHKLKLAYLNNQCCLTLTNKSNPTSTDVYEATIKYDTNKYKDFFIQKQLATYVDFSNNVISSPQKEITKENAEEIFSILLKHIRDTNYYETINERVGTKAFLK